MASVPPVPQLPPVLAATGPFFMFSLEETFELIGDAGFDGAELMIMQDKVSQDPLRLGALAARYGVPVPAVHGPFLVATWLVFGTDPKGKLERFVRFAETAKVSTVVIHPPYRWQTQYATWGNPNEKPAFDYIMSYSPYDNVKAANYPAMLVQVSLNDSQRRSN